MTDLLKTLVQDGEHFAAEVLPDPRDLPQLFAGLAKRLEVTLPQLAEYDIEQLLAAAEGTAQEPAPTEAAAGAGTSITQTPPPAAQAPAQAEVQSSQVAPSESAGTAAGGAPSESRAERLRREADEAEFAEWQAQRGTAAGAQGGAVVSDGEQARATQDSSSQS